MQTPATRSPSHRRPLKPDLNRYRDRTHLSRLGFQICSSQRFLDWQHQLHQKLRRNANPVSGVRTTSGGAQHFQDLIYLFWGKGEREGEIHQCVVASHMSPTGDVACNPSLCPGWESNWQPFGSQASTQSTEPHLPGPQQSVF